MAGFPPEVNNHNDPLIVVRGARENRFKVVIKRFLLAANRFNPRKSREAMEIDKLRLDSDDPQAIIYANRPYYSQIVGGYFRIAADAYRRDALKAEIGAVALAAGYDIDNVYGYYLLDSDLEDCGRHPFVGIDSAYRALVEDQIVLYMSNDSVRKVHIEQPVYVQLAKCLKRTGYSGRGMSRLKTTMHIGGKLTKEAILEIVEIVKLDGFYKIVSRKSFDTVHLRLGEALEECQSLALPLRFISVHDYIVPHKSIAMLAAIPGIGVRTTSIIPWSIGATQTIIVHEGQQAIGMCIDDEAYATSETLEKAIADNTIEKLRSDMRQIDKEAKPLIVITSAREQIAEMANL